MKQLLRNRSGASLIEFALIAPLLFLLLIGIVETGLVFFTISVLEGATTNVARIGKVGATSGGLTREEYIRQEVLRLSGGYLSPNLLVIKTLAYSDFENVGKPEPCITPSPCPGADGVNFIDVNGNGRWDTDMGRSDAGGAGDVVVYRVSYPWPLFTPLMDNILGDGSGTITLKAAATVRNEDF